MTTFDVSWKRHCAKWTFVCGNIFMVFTSLVFMIYVMSFTVHSDVCDGQGVNTSALCLSQIKDEGYLGTQVLVDGGLLPSNWTKITDGAAIVDAQGAAVNDGDGNPTFEADSYAICEWHVKDKRCVEAEPSDALCVSERDSDGRRKYRWGDDAECDALKAPEICKKTGFKDAGTYAGRDKIATAGYETLMSGLGLTVVFILSVLTTINMYWDFLTLIVCGVCGLKPKFVPDDGVIKQFCIGFGSPCKCGESLNCPGTLPARVCGQVDNCALCCKKNKKTEEGFHSEWESQTIVLAFLVHGVLILLLGEIALRARGVVEDECYGVESASLYNVTAADYFDILKDKDAAAYYDWRNITHVLCWIGYVGTAITTGLQLIAFWFANDSTEDMECMALRGGNCEDLNPWAPIGPEKSAAAATLIKTGGSYKPVRGQELYSTRTVQLRGQF